MNDHVNEQSDHQSDLPDNRKAAVAAGLAQYNMIAHERDELQAQVRQLTLHLEQCQVALQAKEAIITELDSRMRSALLERDQAIGDRAVYETLFISFQSLLRAFQVPNEPLVKSRGDDERDAMAALMSAHDPRHYNNAGPIRQFGP